MKKVFLIVSVAFLSFQNQAQTIALKGGVNLANMTAEFIGDAEELNDFIDLDEDNKYNLGFHIGALAEIPFGDMLALESGLLLTTKGYKTNISESSGGINYTQKTSVNLMYLDIPVSLKAKFELNSDSYFYLSGGAYYGIGFTGVNRWETEFGGVTDSDDEEIVFGSGEDSDLSSTDFGLTFGAGLEMNGFIFGLYYDLGLANVTTTYNDSNESLSQKHNGLKLSLGYRFGWDN